MLVGPGVVPDPETVLLRVENRLPDRERHLGEHRVAVHHDFVDASHALVLAAGWAEMEKRVGLGEDAEHVNQAREDGRVGQWNANHPVPGVFFDGLPVLAVDVALIPSSSRPAQIEVEPHVLVNLLPIIGTLVDVAL
jgi:hypothetical protein